jgi:hypothetical protein
MTAFEYVSDPGLNLHHVLYASAFANPRAGDAGRPQAQPLPADLVLRDRPEYHRAVEYYRRRFNDRDLVFDSALVKLKTFLVSGHGAVPPDWRDVFDPVQAIYAETDWPAHDETNRAWSGEVAERMSPLLPEVLDELQRVLRVRLPDGPLRVDTVWVGNAVGAYTTLGPAHVTCSTTHPENRGWSAVEIVLHEASHTLAGPLRHAIRDRIGPSRDGFGPLWHAVLFVLTGETVRRALAGIGVDYQPYVDATGLFDRAWPQWRQPIMDAWTGYLDGTVDWTDACDRLVAGVAP